MAVDPQLRRLGSALNERGQLAARPLRGNRLERRTTREHQANDDSRELLAQRQRADHGHKRDRVHAQAVLDNHGPADLDRQLRSEHRNCHTPHRLPGRTLADEVQQTADHNRGEGEDREDLGAMLHQPHQPAGQAWARATRRLAPTRDGRRANGVHDFSVAANAPAQIRGEYGWQSVVRADICTRRSCDRGASPMFESPPSLSARRCAPVRVAASLALVSAALALSGCGGQGQTTSTSTSSTSGSRAATPPASEAAAVEHQFVAVIRQTRPQVVQIQTDSGLGSGVIFDMKGNIVTNAHVASRWIAGAA